MGDEEVLVNPLDQLDSDEIATTTPEVAKPEDNSEPIQDDKEKEPEKVKEPTAKEVRRAQQEEWSAKEAVRLRNLAIESEVKLAKVDANNLLELAKVDPKLANEVAKRFGYDDLRDAKEQITGIKVEVEKPSEEELETYYQQRKSKEDHEAALVDAENLLKELPQELQKLAIDEFNELVEGKTLTREKALKFATMVTLSLNKGKKKTDNVEPLKKLSSTWMSNSIKPDNSWSQEIVVDGKIVLLDSKQIK